MRQGLTVGGDDQERKDKQLRITKKTVTAVDETTLEEPASKTERLHTIIAVANLTNDDQERKDKQLRITKKTVTAVDETTLEEPASKTERLHTIIAVANLTNDDQERKDKQLRITKKTVTAVDETTLGGPAPRTERLHTISAVANLTNGSASAEIRTGGTRGVSPEREALVRTAELQRLDHEIRELGVQLATRSSETSDEGTQPPSINRDMERDRLLEHSTTGTAKVFELIDRLAEDKKMLWAFAPGKGIRGSVTGQRPEIGQSRRIDGKATKPREWVNDGRYGALCPLAAAYEQEMTDLTEDQVAQIHDLPHEEARRRAKGAGVKTKRSYTEADAAWGLLVAASDDSRLKFWMIEWMNPEELDRLELYSFTYAAIRDWMMLQLEPLPATVIDYDDPNNDETESAQGA